MTTVRHERPADAAAIASVVTAAFGQPDEAELVARLRADASFDPELSFVAVDDDPRPPTSGGEPSGPGIVGDILLSRIHIERGRGEVVPALALAPMAVLPGRQRRGIGSLLVRAALNTARAKNHRLVVVVGHADYYPRFGFEPASRFGLHAPFGVPDAAFMVRARAPGALNQARGRVRYPPPFRLA